MKIMIDWDNKEHTTYRADCMDFPGWPPVGHGKTKEEAVANLFITAKFAKTGGLSPIAWITYIKNEPAEIIDNTIGT